MLFQVLNSNALLSGPLHMYKVITLHEDITKGACKTVQQSQLNYMANYLFHLL